jgi:uncharacterized Zn-binding protein involved in type VI secretion
MGKPAARMGDMTMHGGSIVLGIPTVLIGGMPAARLGDMHVCPMMTPGVPPIPHVGGPVTLGSTGVLIGGMPAARMGDMLVCVGPPDTVAMGCMTVLIGEASPGGGGGGGAGAPAVAAAKASAAIASSGNKESTTKQEHWIEFEFKDKAGNEVSGVHYKLTDTDNKESKSVLKTDGRILRDGVKQGQAKVVLIDLYSAAWSKEKAKVGDKVKLTVKSLGIDNGEKVEFRIFVKDINYADHLLTTLEANINSDKAEVEWEMKVDEEYIKIVDEKKNIGRYSLPFFYFDAYCNELVAKSPLLYYDDFIELNLVDTDNKPVKNEDYIIYLPNGEVRKGKLDGNGYKKEEKIPPGLCNVIFPNYKVGKSNEETIVDKTEDVGVEENIKEEDIAEDIEEDNVIPIAGPEIYDKEIEEWKLKVKVKCRFPKVQLSGTIEIQINKSGEDAIQTIKKDIFELDTFRTPVEDNITGKEEGTYFIVVKGKLKRTIQIVETRMAESKTEDWISKKVEVVLKNGDEKPVDLIIDSPDTLEVAGGYFWAYSYVPTKTNKRGGEIILLFQPKEDLGNDGDTVSLIQTVKDMTKLTNIRDEDVKPNPTTSQLFNRTLTAMEAQGDDIGTGIDQEVLEEKSIELPNQDHLPVWRRKKKKTLVVVNIDPRYSETRLSEAAELNTAGKSISLGSVKSAKKENGVWSGASLNDQPGLTLKLSDGTTGKVSGYMEFEVAAFHNNDKKFYGSVKWGWKMIGADPALDPPKVKVEDYNRASNRFFKAAKKWNETKIIDPTTGTQHNPMEIPLI